MQLWRPAVAPVTRFVNASNHVICILLPREYNERIQGFFCRNGWSFGTVDPEDYSSPSHGHKKLRNFYWEVYLIVDFGEIFYAPSVFLPRLADQGRFECGSCPTHWINNNSDKNRLRSSNTPLFAEGKQSRPLAGDPAVYCLRIIYYEVKKWTCRLLMDII